nr:MAG TPA: hypothetical protein [Bacteriophage sp.]
MLAFKGFNSDMTCTMGSGKFQYKVGKKYTEKEANCTRNGFHCCENPLDVLSWYGGRNDRFCVVKADGEINQDNVGTKISCTKITIIKEITRLELAACACEYIRKHPKRAVHSIFLLQNTGECREKDGFVIVRGKNPRAKAVEGGAFFLIKEEKNNENIKEIYLGCAGVDGIKPNVYYGIRGQRICEEKS